ncbi:DUF6310 domain-containing protein [Melittangium boletus]|uniref:DUF6310 domain-containing protein n=1 Tax=Melittangium boletus TaxID=83453 RepID=UPI003DA312D6
MRFRACTALLLYLSACATSSPGPETPVDTGPRLTNLQRAATLPWTDGGRCVVQEASHPWPVLAERCYPALDHGQVEFHDLTGRCSVASAGAVAVGLGLCVLAAPEIVVGAVVVTGVVVVGFAIKEALAAYESRQDRSETTSLSRNLSPRKRPKPESKGATGPPLEPPETAERERPRCEPTPVPYHLGGNKLHDTCADRVPGNSFSGGDVFVNGKNFDALQNWPRARCGRSRPTISTHTRATFADS